MAVKVRCTRDERVSAGFIAPQSLSFGKNGRDALVDDARDRVPVRACSATCEARQPTAHTLYPSEKRVLISPVVYTHRSVQRAHRSRHNLPASSAHIALPTAMAVPTPRAAHTSALASPRAGEEDRLFTGLDPARRFCTPVHIPPMQPIS